MQDEGAEEGDFRKNVNLYLPNQSPIPCYEREDNIMALYFAVNFMWYKKRLGYRVSGIT